jgi:hypothetical protein
MNDFERLKKICEREGFELLNESLDDNDKFFVVKKKRVNVQFKTSGGFSKEDNTIWEYKFEFIVTNKPKENLNQYGDFLAQQLEEHLNNKQNEAEDELNQKS